MKNVKRIIAIVMALSLIFVFAACGGDKDNKESSNAAQGTKTDSIKIGVIHIGDPASGSGFSFAHQQGIDKMQETIGKDKVEVVQKTNVDDNDEAAIERAINELIEANCKIIFGTSWNYMGKMKAAAEEHSEIFFLHCSGSESNGKNFFNYFGRIFEARYLAGIVAGMNTKTNKIGYVAAQGDQNAEVTGGINAFALGVKSVKPDAKVLVQVTNTWFDLNLEKSAAIALLDKGCDFITQHQDTAQPVLAAQEKGVMAIGYNSDFTTEAPKAVVTNVVWDWSVYYTEAVQKIMNGEKVDNYFTGMKEGLVNLTAINETLVTAGTKEKVEEAKAKIIDGSLQIFAGEIKDNKGTVRVEKGKDLSVEYIAREMNWYVDNVQVG